MAVGISCHVDGAKLDVAMRVGVVVVMVVVRGVEVVDAVVDGSVMAIVDSTPIESKHFCCSFPKY